MNFTLGQEDYFGPFNTAIYDEYERLLADYEARSGKPASEQVKAYLKTQALDSIKPDGGGEYALYDKRTIVANPVEIKGSQPGKWTPVLIGVDKRSPFIIGAIIAGILAWSQLK